MSEFQGAGVKLHFCNRAIRVGDWKLVADHQKPWELYDLGADRSESKNLASKRPGKVKELEQVWMKHMEEFRTLAAQNLPKDRSEAAQGQKAGEK